MRERALPDNLRLREGVGGGTLIELRQWASPSPVRRGGAPAARASAEALAPTVAAPAADARAHATPLAKSRHRQTLAGPPVVERPPSSACDASAVMPRQDEGNDPEALAAALGQLIACPDAGVAFAALDQARAWLDVAAWLRQLAVAGERHPAPAARAQFAGLALAWAWQHLQRDGLADAEASFATALDLSGAAEAHHGLALIALRQERHDAALRHAEALPQDFSGRGELLRDVLVADAQARYAAGEWRAALELLAAAEQAAPLPRHGRSLAAWSRLALGEAAAAADAFATLYRAAPDAESAQGIVAAFPRAGRAAEIAALATGEPLAGLNRRRLADQAYGEKRFLAARALDAEQYGADGGAGIPAAEAAWARRVKRAGGLAQMSLDWRPALALRWPGRQGDEWTLRLDELHFASTGRLAGRRPDINATQARLEWRSDGKAEDDGQWEAALGLTPDGGAVTPTWDGLLARRWQRDGAQLRLAFARQPLKESVLSHVGLRDPATGRAWGRVLESGIQAAWRVSLDARWSAQLRIAGATLDGAAVADNRHAAAEAGVGFDLRLKDFDYAVLGLNLSVDRYARNLGQFTPGHGGYFSPQRYLRLGPAFDFMTAERRDYMLKGRIAVGATDQHEAAAPRLPLADGGARYAAAGKRGIARDFELGAVWQATPNLQLGGWLAYRQSPNYEDRAAMFFVRILLEPRRAVLSSDLPNQAAGRLFQ
jgi:hypothetical protein